MAEPLTPERLIGERIAGRFVIDRAIGSGPLSSAFRASDELLQRRVTVKLFHPQHPDDSTVVDSQLDLATAVARLSHPNIVTVIDRGEHEGMPFIVLEYVRGENLGERIERYAPLDAGEVVQFGLSIARALAYAHGQGVVHGNLRPANVLISEDRQIKLVDFGGGSYLATLTGSDSYLSPERRAAAGNHLDLEASDDIFAFGVLLFVALTELDPAAGIDVGQLQMLRPDAPPKLANVVMRAMAEAVEDRYESMQELAADLASVRPARALAADAPAFSEDTSPGLDVIGLDPDATGAMVAVPASSASAPRSRAERPSGRELRARLVAWSMLLVPIAALVLVAIIIAGERDRPGKRGSGGARQAQAPSRPIPLPSAGSFDPEGDGVEHQEEVPLLHDGQPGTATGTSWQTEGYDTALGKAGVGVWVRTQRPVAATGLRLRTDLQGWSYQVFAATSPGAKLVDWTPVSKPASAEDSKLVRLDTDSESYAYYLIWITRLSLDTADTNKLRARIGEVTVLAPGA